MQINCFLLKISCSSNLGTFEYFHEPLECDLLDDLLSPDCAVDNNVHQHLHSTHCLVHLPKTALHP